ncbi:MAG: hypothetical protein EPO68_17630 [Planctomycetota bacterium]|nr:MAG: hypothetical protein EPO68_17630 [Planctomycetota bacterium]
MAEARASLRARLLPRVLLGALGAAFAVLAAELVLRAVQPDFLLRVALEAPHPPWEALHPKLGLFALDDELAFVPVLGGPEYDRYGIRNNPYSIDKRPGVERVVFLGDSATKRGKIVAALRAEFGDERREYWNAGVESYNTWQELGYFRRYASQCRPDHVVLVFHLGDYEVQPLCWIDRSGWAISVHPSRPPGHYQPWLMKHAWLYRAWLAWRWRDDSEPIVRDYIRGALAGLRDTCARDHVKLSVLVLPIVYEEALWPPLVFARRDAALAQLEELGIRAFDLSVPLRAAVEAGVRPLQDPPGDPLHPSPEVAAYFRRYLREQRLFE